jgi:hypothetical protein
MEVNIITTSICGSEFPTETMGYSRGFRETACGDGDCERRLFSPAKKLCSISTEI